ncbi:MAG: putative alkyl dihydroxyacetonephosphate synthase agp [Myxococcales bacterium]|nr:putative alkyl dihydroxyacetonephosphate synthase agp [Myxococcales bacterium]
MRDRSIWAWGWRDKFPDPGARQGLMQLARVLVPAAHTALRDEPPDEPSVPSPAIATPAALAEIASQAPRDRAMRSRGRAFPDLVAGFAGDYTGAPDLVVRPRDEAEVARVLEVCDANAWAVVPFGGGTSVVGGVDAALARRDRAAVVSLDLGAIAGVREVDPVSRLARIGAGTLGPALEDELATHGLTLRHYPQSFEMSTLGGWLATRAGGHYATGPTRIDELAHAMTMITPRGLLATHRHPGSGAGPEPARMVLGSEGALGVITEAWMRVVPRPRWRASASVAYKDFTAGVAAARALAQSGLYPSNARLLDGNEARLHRVRFDGTSVLLIGFESADHPLGPWLARALELARDHGGEVVSGPSEADDATRSGAAGAWRQAFFDAPYLQSALLSIGVLSDTFETACSWTQFPELHACVTAAVQRALDEECGGGIVSCRFTHVYPDGPAPYYTFIGALRAGGELAQWRAVKAAASEALAAAGGTITHHHAVGRTHRPWYDRERPALFGEALAAVKRTLDPHGILNPGVLVD